MTDTDKKHIGIVKWFNSEKGWGFITEVDQNGEVMDKNALFVHFTDIATRVGGLLELEDKEPVEFEIEQGDYGKIAGKVKRLKIEHERDPQAYPHEKYPFDLHARSFTDRVAAENNKQSGHSR